MNIVFKYHSLLFRIYNLGNIFIVFQSFPETYSVVNLIELSLAKMQHLRNLNELQSIHKSGLRVLKGF